jgi:Protein of unknown function (DUF4229)
MNPMLKYSLARIGLFLAVAAILLVIPFELNILIKLAIAVLVSALLALFLLRGLRDEVAAQLAGAQQRRAVEKERLRAALADDQSGEARGEASASSEARNGDGERTDSDPV